MLLYMTNHDSPTLPKLLRHSDVMQYLVDVFYIYLYKQTNISICTSENAGDAFKGKQSR